MAFEVPSPQLDVFPQGTITDAIETNDMTPQIQVLEKQTRDHDLVLGKEYVSRQQVQEMEMLFATAVEGLNNRLRNVETRKVEDKQHVSSGDPTNHRSLG